MKKLPIVLGITAALLFAAGVAVAAEEQDEDKIIAACEDKYDVKKYTDENERNKLIEECIESQLSGKKE